MKSAHKHFLLIALTFLIISNISCRGGKHGPQTSYDNSNLATKTSSNTANSGPTYNEQIKPIFEKACIPCHASGSPNGNWLEYKVVYAKRALIKNRIFEKKDMPFGKSISDETRALIAKWVDSGAAEKSIDTETTQTPTPATDNKISEESPSPSKDSTDVTTQQPPLLTADAMTYVDHVKPFFEKYCSVCHNENSDVSMPNWLKYDIVVLKKDALLTRLIVKKDMPIIGMPAPSDEERELINQWISKGMKYEK
ncbi:MAG: hypothetical protein L6Q37_05435 [Bdellovibrionaceae bacterium]|nr:hypothetical protein [Pseudobdellovibrionaceae bacterium]NUM58759.1 hypothetical protein [Pseudobdellovibrionaceae bacterium]